MYVVTHLPIDCDGGCITFVNFSSICNSLAPGRPGCHFKTAIFNLVLLIGIFTSSKDNALRWMPWDLTDDKSALVPVFDFYAGPSARGRQLYCRACNFKSVSALWAGNFYTCHVEPNGVPLSMDTDATRFYSKDIHLVMIQTNTRQRCVPS